MTQSKRELTVDILFDIVGCLMFSVAIQCFSAPNHIAPGGVSGVSVLVNYLFDMPISLFSFALNIPLLILAWVFLGHRFTLRTLKTVIIMTVTLELCAGLPAYRGNLILAALCGGVLEGLGLAMVFTRSSTTGGTDIASRLIQLRFPHVSVGKLMIAVDGCVLLASAIVYRHIENALYGLIVIYTCGRVIDGVLYGLDAGKAMMIVSDKYEEIAGKIMEELHRGCTILEGAGSYTGHKRQVLFCAVRKPQFIRVKRIVRSVDPAAFMVAMEAGEIIGEGFKDIES